jgi:ribosome maturation factor RimP
MAEIGAINDSLRMDRETAIMRIIEPALTEAGYDLVRVQFMGGQGDTLQIMVERQDRRAITVNDCANVSRLVSPILDVEDPVKDPYMLEVSSPGLDRPLVRPDDYVRFSGFRAKVVTTRPIDGVKKFEGAIAGLEGDTVLLSIDGVRAELPFEDIKKASLVLTDELIEAARQEAEAATEMER